MIYKFLKGSIKCDYVNLSLQSIGVNLFVLFSSFISSSLLAHMLGPEGRGKLAIILLWPMLFASLGILGLDKATSYYCGKFYRRVNEILFTSWLLVAILSFLVYLAGYSLLPYILTGKEKQLLKTSQFCMILVPIMFVGNMPYWVLHGLGKLKLWNFVRCIHIWLWISLIVFAYLTNNITPFFLAKLYVFSMTINCSIWLGVYFFTVKNPPKINFKLVPDLIKYGIFSWLSNIPNQLNIRLDQLVMSIFLSARELGLYVVAVQWSGILSPVMLGLGQVAFPKMLHLQTGNKATEFLPIIKYSILIGSFLALVLMVFTPFILPLVFGAKFKSAIYPALVLIIASFILGVNSILDEIIKGLGMPYISAISQFVGCLVNIIFIIPFLKYFSILGASVLSLICYSITLFVMLLNLKKKFSFRFIELFPGKREFKNFWKLMTEE